MSSPKKGVAYVFQIGLVDSATGAFRAAPTIAAGDFKISKDDGALANLATLPQVLPAAGVVVKVSLSAAEMTADKVTIVGIDVAGAQWDNVLIFIDATTANVDDVVRSTVPANTLDIAATGEVGIDFNNILGQLSAGSIATNAFTAAKFAADAITKIRDGILPTANTALANLSFLFVSSTDHVTPVTGATVITGTRSIDGGAFVAITGTIAEVGNGIYQFDASAADMNGGKIIFRFAATGGSPVAPDDAFLSVVTGTGV